MITAVILAAGESQRMNSPKAMLAIGSETFAACVARKIGAVGIQTQYLVAGAHWEEIQSAYKDAPFQIVFNPKYKEGQLVSLQEALKHLPENATAALVWPVDQPLVTEDTVTQLLGIFREKQGSITIPSYHGRKGHPVIYNKRAIDTLLSFGPDHTAKDLQAIYAADTTIVQVNDEAVLIDIDTPEDYARHIKRADL